jgi:hypothetical protein
MTTYFYRVQGNLPAGPQTLANGYIQCPNEQEALRAAGYLRYLLLGLDRVRDLGLTEPTQFSVSVIPFDLDVELERTHRLLNQSAEAIDAFLLRDAQAPGFQAGALLPPLTYQPQRAWAN